MEIAWEMFMTLLKTIQNQKDHDLTFTYITKREQMCLLYFYAYTILPSSAPNPPKHMKNTNE